MIFREAVDTITALIKRPDKEADVKVNINEAISVAALRNFSRDLIEFTLPIVATDYSQRIALTNPTYWTRFSRIKYIRPTGYRKSLTHRDPSKVWINGTETVDCWYHSGTGLIVRLGRLQSTLEVGYYRYHATLTQDEGTDWMLDEMWPYVYNYAASKSFGAIGNEQERARYFAEATRLSDAYFLSLGDRVAYA